MSLAGLKKARNVFGKRTQLEETFSPGNRRSESGSDPESDSNKKLKVKRRRRS